MSRNNTNDSFDLEEYRVNCLDIFSRDKAVNNVAQPVP